MPTASARKADTRQLKPNSPCDLNGVVRLQAPVAGRRFTEMEVPARVQPLVQAKAGSIFTVFRGAAILLATISVFVWGGATAVNDTTGEVGGLVFLLASAGVVVFAFVAGHNVQLFVTAEVVGIVGPLGGVRTCPRSELAEIRTVWHWYQGRGMGSWVFPTLHFRKRDTTDAFVTFALLYEDDELHALGAYLRTPIDLERPTASRAA